MMNKIRWIGASLIPVVAIGLIVLIVTTTEATAVPVMMVLGCIAGGVTFTIIAMNGAHRAMKVEHARYLWYEGNNELSVKQEINALKKEKRGLKIAIQSESGSYRLRTLYGALQDVDSKISMLKGSKRQKLTHS